MRLHRPTLYALTLLAPAAAASAQTFSIDNHGPLIGTPDSFGGVPLTEGDILTSATGGPPGPNSAVLGPQPPPGIYITGGFGAPGLGLGAHAGCVGHGPGTPCPVEVDALSYGVDSPLPPNTPTQPGMYYFSVDEYAVGFAVPGAPNVTSEGAAGPEFQASGDVFTDLGVPIPGPYPPFAFAPGNTAVVDGDGMPNGGGFAYRGLGLIEPDLPGLPPDSGDNLDAVDIDTTQFGRVFFSLDGSFVDPINGFPLTGAAVTHGVSGGDVLVNTGGAPVVYAPAGVLGLDLAGGFDTDDLDALALWDNGDAVYQPSQQPYDWAAGAGTDMLLFSVRRGSAVIGMPDSIFGIPIQPGDILTTPLPTALGGVSPFPGIFMAAENLGLTTAAPRGGFGVAFGDDLDALDIARQAVYDCNGNGLEDATDIASGSSLDTNTNGVPDECESVGTAYCFCPAASAICGNLDPSAGCANSSGSGALLTGSGSTSVLADDLVLTSTAPTSVFGIFFFGPNMINTPFGDGRRCVGGSVRRFLPIQNSGAGGTFTLGPGIVAYTVGTFSPSHQIASGDTWNFQSWFRDAMGPCGNGFNLSNGYSVTFTP